MSDCWSMRLNKGRHAAQTLRFEWPLKQAIFDRIVHNAADFFDRNTDGSEG
jgi:hypothetical protein